MVYGRQWIQTKNQLQCFQEYGEKEYGTKVSELYEKKEIHYISITKCMKAGNNFLIIDIRLVSLWK